MIYLLKMRSGKIERWDGATFNAWVTKQKRVRIGGNFQVRLDQLRKYTGQDVVDWEMEMED